MQLVEGDVEDLLITQSTISNSNAPSWICARKLPWWVASNDIEEAATCPQLTLPETLPVEIHHVVREGYGPELLDVGFFGKVLQPLIMLLFRNALLLESIFELLLDIGVLLVEEFLLQDTDIEVDVFDEGN